MSDEKQDTIADIVREMRDAEAIWHRSEIAQLPTQYLKDWSDRIEANFAETIEVIEAGKAIEAALYSPPRNCDVGTAEEQYARFDAHCRNHMGCLTCPLREKEGAE